MVLGSPFMCMRHTGQPDSATTSTMASSKRSALTSLMSAAPAASARRATSAFIVSTEMGTPTRSASASTTGTTRRNSSSTGTASDPGRVDSPPMSMMAAPSRTSARLWASASSASKNRPPSENESGVTFTIPMRQGKRMSSEQVGGTPVTGRWRQRGALMRANASARVASCDWMMPRTALVTVLDPGVRTPRMDMQRCSASMSTSAPAGFEGAHDGVGDLGGDALLQLRARRHLAHHPGQLGEAA